MSFNTFGRFFRITTFGESHGPAIGVIIDGLPPRLPLDLEAIQKELRRRRPGGSDFASPRREPDQAEVVSGLCEGQTTGAPLCLIIVNTDAKPQAYEPLRHIFRPGHADLTYWKKYGIRDWRGGGRSSGRETATRVAAGAVARQILSRIGIHLLGHVVEIAGIRAKAFDPLFIEQNPLRCADAQATKDMEAAILDARQEGDSVGGIVEVRASGVPAGWGDPIFGKLDALLAYALMSIGAVKGVEIGDGFDLARRRGSYVNDQILPEGFASNHAGGILGGISCGSDIVIRLAVKPTPSISQPQQTINESSQPTTITIQGRHDPCIAPRLVPVAEAMVALVLVDAYLAQQAINPVP